MKLEKMADEYIKKTKEAVKSGKSNGGDGSDNCVAKCREDSARRMEEVERSVRESVMGLANSKRICGVQARESDSKHLKIWYGNRKLGKSESEVGSEEQDKEEDQKFVIIATGSLFPIQAKKPTDALVASPDMVRSQMNLKRLSLTDIKIDIKRVPKKKALVAAMEADVKLRWEKSLWGQKAYCSEEKGLPQ